jgi:cytochrome c oxidase cbb3-type subunit 3
VLVAVTAAAALLLGAFVFRPGRSAGDVREWTPADHDQPAGAGQAPPPKAKQGQPKGSGQQDASLVEMAWTKSCASCHGPGGRGDGPSGPMVKAPDLTRADWQDRVTDEQIAETIKNGRNSMPKFDLPPNVLQGLVARIRASKAKR